MVWWYFSESLSLHYFIRTQTSIEGRRPQSRDADLNLTSSVTLMIRLHCLYISNVFITHVLGVNKSNFVRCFPNTQVASRSAMVLLDYRKCAKFFQEKEWRNLHGYIRLIAVGRIPLFVATILSHGELWKNIIIPLHSMNFNALFVKNILGGCLR